MLKYFFHQNRYNIILFQSKNLTAEIIFHHMLINIIKKIKFVSFSGLSILDCPFSIL